MPLSFVRRLTLRRHENHSLKQKSTGKRKRARRLPKLRRHFLDIYERKWPKFWYVFRNVTEHQPDELAILSERIGGPTYRASMWSLLSKYSPDVSQANRTAWQECKDNDERGLYVLIWVTSSTAKGREPRLNFETKRAFESSQKEQKRAPFYKRPLSPYKKRGLKAVC